MFKLTALQSLVSRWLEAFEVKNPQFAQLVCQLIPARCPFERNIQVFGYTVVHIPPLCKLNPFYEQIVSLRFKCLCYLADQCGQDVTIYC